jgi:hypothetical protein
MKVNDITKLVDKSLTNTDNVFDSLKEHRTAAIKGPATKTKGPTKGPVKEKPLEFANKYVRLGKISEFNITQKPPKKSIAQTNEMLFSSKPITKMADFFDDLEIEEENLFLPPTKAHETHLIVEKPLVQVSAPMDTEKISSYKMFKNLKAASL